MPSSPRAPRLLACARCFRLKRRCDHAKPTCGECKRRGTECLPGKSCKDGENITISLEYLRFLETKIAELTGSSNDASRTTSQVRDVGVQTDPINNANADPPRTPTFGETDTPAEGTTGILTASQEVYSTLESCSSFSFELIHTAALRTDVIPADSHQGAQRLEAPLISRVAYEMYPSHAGLGVSPWTGTQVLQHPAFNDDPLEEVYTNLYFTITHWVWPFLDRSTWKSWHYEWTHGKETDKWKGFFILMVYAIGALLNDGLHPEQGYAARASDLYASAMTYYPYVMGDLSAITQIKASILMTLYSLHCPSSEEISVTVSSIIPFCAATMSELRKRTSSIATGDETHREKPGEAFDGALTEPLFITCYMLNEIIVSGWDRPVSSAYRAVDDDMYTLSCEMPSSSSTNSALKHLFSLRKIQAKIRQRGEVSQNDADNSLLKSALDTWKRDIPQYGIEDCPSTYLHPLWMASLYDYSVIILMQEKRHRLQHDDFEDILSASSEVCLNFRRLQDEGQVMCYTWSALVFQFMVGIMLLYAFWVDNRDDISKKQASDTACTCARSLSHFAERWQDAVPYFKVFSYLLGQAKWIPDNALREPNYDFPRDELEYYLQQLKKQYLHKGVLSMIEDMISE